MMMFDFIKSTYDEVSEEREKLHHCCCIIQKTLKPLYDGNKDTQKRQVQTSVEKYKTICEAESEEVKAMTKLLAKADRTLTLLKQKSESHLLAKKLVKHHIPKLASAGDADQQPYPEALSNKQPHDIHNKSGQHLAGSEDMNTKCMLNENVRKLEDDSCTGVITQSKLSRLLSETGLVNTKKYLPAHKAAPYKTDPSVPRLKRPPLSKTSKHTSSHNQQETNKAGHSQRKTKSDKKISHHKKVMFKSPTYISDVSSCNPNHFKYEEKNEGTIDSGLLKEEYSNEWCVAETKRADFNTLDSLEEKDEQSLNDQDRNAGSSSHKCPTVESDRNIFSVPPKLKHVYAKNRKLRQSIACTLKEMHNAEMSHGSVMFLHKFYESMTGESCAIFRRKVDVITQSYSTLAEILHNLQLNNISESSSVREMCRARVVLEFILNTFQALSEESRFILADYKQREYEQIYNDSAKFDPFEIKTSTFSIFTQRPSTPAHVQYTKERHLLEYWDLCHRYDLLTLHLHAAQLLESEYIPMLKDLQTSESFMPVYRALYSLLCSERPSFPTFVRDSSEDEASDNQH